MKRGVADLAVFGGLPEFRDPLHTNRPQEFDRARLFDRLSAALDRRWLSNGGPLVREFEESVATLSGVRHCVAMCNGTVALQVLYHAAGITGQIVMPSLTYSATAHAARWLGVEPVFCDVDPGTGCADPESAARAMTAATTAMVGVHLWGRTCDVDRLEKVAADHRVPVFFDAAHAIGCTYRGRRVGSLGGGEVFSFHATKVVSAFEGGALVTNDDGLAALARGLHNFGKGLTGPVAAAGTNAKMSEASAAMGLTSLEAFPHSVHRNRQNRRAYHQELAGVAGLALMPLDEDEDTNYQYVTLLIDEEVTGIGRDLLLRVLRAENAVALPPIGSPACHQLEPYRTSNPVSLPHTERLVARVISLPSGSSVSLEEIHRICEVVRCAVAHGPQVRARATRHLSNPPEQGALPR